MTSQTPCDIQWKYGWSFTLYDFLSYPMSRVQALQQVPQLLPSCIKTTTYDPPTPFPLNCLENSPLALPFKISSFLKFVPDSYLTLYTIYVKQGTSGLYKGFLMHLFHLFLNDSVKYFLLTKYFNQLDTSIHETFQWNVPNKPIPLALFSTRNNKTTLLSNYLSPLPFYLSPLSCDSLKTTVSLPCTSLCQTTSQILMKLLADFLCYPILSLQTKLSVIENPILINPYALALTVYKPNGVWNGFYKGVPWYLTVKCVEYTSEWMFYHFYIPCQRNKRYEDIKTNQFSSLSNALTSPLTALSFQQRTQCVLPYYVHTTASLWQTTTWKAYLMNVFFATFVTYLYCQQNSH